jgi:N-acyl-D-amino-acid deacylase
VKFLFDLIIKNGKIIDGSGNPWFKSDIGIKEGMISKIGKIKVSGDPVLYAEGQVVAPGFIDLHGHSDIALTLEEHPRLLEPLITQGVTTQVIGNCGMSPAPTTDKSREIQKENLKLITPKEVSWQWSSMEDYLKLLDEQGVILNVVPLTGHGALRSAIMGNKTSEPDEEELRMMKSLLADSFEQGSFGLSTGLIYPPGMWSTTSELVELGQVTYKYGRIFTSHLRGYSETLIKAVDEVIEVGRVSGCKVEISHHQAFGERYWKELDKTLNQIEKARTSGIDVAFDVIPYTTANTTILAIYPPWALKGGVSELIKRLQNREEREEIKKWVEHYTPEWPPWGMKGWPHNLVKATGWKNIVLLYLASEKNRKLVGKNLEELGIITGKHPFDAISDLVIEERGEIMALYIGLSGDLKNEEPLLPLIKHPYASLVTDAIFVEKGIHHPAAHSCYPRVIGHYSIHLRLFSLEEAIRKITSLPAQRVGLWRRGLIREGMLADLVIFDPEEVKEIDSNHPEHSKGINWVIINGEPVVEDGKYQSSLRPGQVLRKKN